MKKFSPPKTKGNPRYEQKHQTKTRSNLEGRPSKTRGHADSISCKKSGLGQPKGPGRSGEDEIFWQEKKQSGKKTAVPPQKSIRTTEVEGKTLQPQRSSKGSRTKVRGKKRESKEEATKRRSEARTRHRPPTHETYTTKREGSQLPPNHTSFRVAQTQKKKKQDAVGGVTPPNNPGLPATNSRVGRKHRRKMASVKKETQRAHEEPRPKTSEKLYSVRVLPNRGVDPLEDMEKAARRKPGLLPQRYESHLLHEKKGNWGLVFFGQPMGWGGGISGRGGGKKP